MISAEQFSERRAEFMRMIGADGVALIPGGQLQTRNNDVHFPFRQDSDFWYLTGFDEPDALLVLAPGRQQGSTVLFCRDRDPERERWDGVRVGVEQARERYGFDDTFPIEVLDDVAPGLLEGYDRILYNLGRSAFYDNKVINWIQRLHGGQRKSRHPPEELVSLTHSLHELRLFKSKQEIKAMQQAAKISAAAHQRLMQICRPGMNEAELGATLHYEFMRQQCQASYLPIVGGGNNACILHYIDNNQPLRDGDLVLVDAGCEAHKYAADITRTFPVNGRFSAEQKALYEIVLEAQLAAIAEARPERSWIGMHDAATRVIAQGLLDLGLIKGSLEEVLEAKSYEPFFMHKTGHWLGLDVHDVGDYKVDDQWRQLEKDMVLTVEPGIYISADNHQVDERWRGIGIRIEDDVLVTRQQPKVLSSDAVKTVADIESLMND
ncbi:MAG: Xaa-Pro aminopeptidase [Wenzhouxiangellaceae bacterium]